MAIPYWYVIPGKPTDDWPVYYGTLPSNVPNSRVFTSTASSTRNVFWPSANWQTNTGWVFYLDGNEMQEAPAVPDECGAIADMDGATCKKAPRYSVQRVEGDDKDKVFHCCAEHLQNTKKNGDLVTELHG